MLNKIMFLELERRQFSEIDLCSRDDVASFFLSVASVCHLSSITIRYTTNHITDLLEAFFSTDRFWSGWCDSMMMMRLVIAVMLKF